MGDIATDSLMIWIIFLNFVGCLFTDAVKVFSETVQIMTDILDYGNIVIEQDGCDV